MISEKYKIIFLDTIRRSECRSDNHCKPWPKTSCGKDPVDGQRRCLCADQTHPINDDCITSPQGNFYNMFIGAF